MSTLTETQPQSQSQLADGRRARGERTRLKVIEALLELVENGDVRPTAQEVAARAGVALRTVYHHFEDVEALRRLALDLQMTRHLEYLTPIDPALPLAERIRLVSYQCRRLFEAVAPIRRATLFDQQSSPEMAEGIAACTATRERHIAAVFSPELAGDDEDAVVVGDAAFVVSSWATWEYVRSMLGRSPTATEQVLVKLLSALLEPRAKRTAPTEDQRR